MKQAFGMKVLAVRTSGSPHELADEVVGPDGKLEVFKVDRVDTHDQ